MASLVSKCSNGASERPVHVWIFKIMKQYYRKIGIKLFCLYSYIYVNTHPSPPQHMVTFSWSLLGGHRNPLMHMLVFRRTSMKETGVCCSWCSPGGCGPTVPLLGNDAGAGACCRSAPPLSSVWVFEMCQPDVQGLHLLEAPSFTSSLWMMWKTHTCGRTHFQMSTYQAEVHSCWGKKKCQLPARALKKWQRFRQKCSNLTFYLSPLFCPEISTSIMFKNRYDVVYDTVQHGTLLVSLFCCLPWHFLHFCNWKLTVSLGKANGEEGECGEWVDCLPSAHAAVCQNARRMD